MSVRLLEVRSAKSSRTTSVPMKPASTLQFMLKQIAADFGIKASRLDGCDVRVVDADGNSASHIVNCFF
jgi:hypothetical protein